MKRFRGFVVKEFYHIFRDYRTLLILFGMPAAQLMLFGYVITNEIKNAKIAIYDQSKDEVTRKISEKILSSGYFILQENLTNYQQIEGTFREGKTKLVLVFEPDFAGNLTRTGKANLQILGDASDPNTANILVNYASGIITNYLITSNLSRTGYQIVPEVRMQYNPELKGVFMFV
ncbi:MAG TPA: ABC transporter permease, partial [Bacteroidales bacterium]|nr:ABC transporter permease [Bacteroidales bacterium]